MADGFFTLITIPLVQSMLANGMNTYVECIVHSNQGQCMAVPISTVKDDG